ncbi:MAG: S1C family serine protease [Caulobacteraceae bacterium]
MQEDFEDWEITPDAQPRPADYGYDLDTALSAVVGLEAEIPADAYTAEILGEARGGNGVLIDDSGLVLTIGYLVTEAERVRLHTRHGQVVDGHVLGIDQASGLGLVQAMDLLDVPSIKLGDSRHAGLRESVVVGGAGGRKRSVAAHIVARQEFAGYWEYLIEEAIFTTPAHPNWGGTALIGPAGDLLGIGSLQLQHQASGGRVLPLNMMVPIELLTPVYDQLKAGKRTQVRPWLGLFAQDHDNTVMIVGLAGEGPASRAGLREGDVVRSAAGMDLTNLADFYRSIWALGGPGAKVPLVVEREGDVFDLTVVSADRQDFLKKPRFN